MDSMNNKNQTEQSSQDELDLGINSLEPITPKKSIQSTESFFGKAKGFFSNKEPVETKFNVRKEPTFGGNSTSEPALFVAPNHLSQGAEPTVAPFKTTSSNSSEQLEIKPEPVVVESTMEESHIDEVKEGETQVENRSFTQPEKWKILQILPAKHRRLFIAILALVILLIIFFALKPNSDTVESLTQQSGNEIPVQFQSLDQDKPVENTILDHNVNQSEETAPQQMEYVGNEQEANAQQAVEKQVTLGAENMTKSEAPSSSMNSASYVAQPQVPVQDQAEPVQAPVTTTPAVESAPKKAAEQVVTHKPTQQTTLHSQVANGKKEVKTVEKASKQNGHAPIIEAKPAAQDKKEHKAKVVDSKPAETKSSAGASKTLTVPKGVSLMQVFRDHQLNISDVNAMSKANGSGNVLSNFKSGDKVTVSLNSQGRVTEMRLSNGARFVRQSDGSYQYKK